MTTYTYATTLVWGGDEPTAELEVTCSYSVAWGSPECGRGYMADPALYDPGSPDVLKDIKILTVEGKPWPVDIPYGYQIDAQLHEMLVEKLESEHEYDMLDWARMKEGVDPDGVREARLERLRDGF